MAEDLAQNVLLVVFQRSGELREADLFPGWVFAIARNELLRSWRQSRARIQTVEFDSVEMESNHHFHLEPPFMQDARFYEWLKYLEPTERELVILRFVEELSYEDLALVFEVPLGTVKWRLFQVKKKLTKIIGAEFPDQVFIN